MQCPSDICPMISAVSSVIALFVATIGALFLYEQIRSDHDRSRRQAAIDLIMEWSRSFYCQNLGIRKFVESLSKQQCEALSQGLAFDADDKYLHIVTGLLKEEFPGIRENIKKVDGIIHFDREQSWHLRACVIRYLNTLESVLSSYHYGVADKVIIEKYFDYLLDETNGYAGLSIFRGVPSRTYFPAIERFTRDRGTEQQENRFKAQKAEIYASTKRRSLAR